MRLLEHVAILWSLALALAGCHAPGPAAREGRDVEPGRIDFVSVYCIRYMSDSSGTVLRADDEARTAVELTNLHPHKLLYPRGLTEGIELWVVGRVASRTELRSYSDSDGDLIVDAPTATVLFTGTQPETVQAAAFDPVSGTLYLLDEDGNVYRATDTDGDRRPDTIPSTPFVAATWQPGEPDPVWLTVEDPDTGKTERIPGGRSMTATALLDPTATSVVLMATMAEIGRAEDDDGDGVADAIVPADG